MTRCPGWSTPASIACLLAVGTSMGGAHIVEHRPAATVLTLEGFTVGPGVPAPWNESVVGPLCREASACESVPYWSWGWYVPPLSIAHGVLALDEALAGSQGERIVYGYSYGAIVSTAWLGLNAGNPDAPDPDTLSFVLVGNPFRVHNGILGLIGEQLPESQYHVTDVTRQYDPQSDFPDNPLNVVALANAAAGFLFVHLDYTQVELDDPDNTTWTSEDGRTTYVFVPTENLPLLEPLRLIGMTELADRLNDPLKEIVEAGYDRDLPVSDPGTDTAVDVDGAVDFAVDVVTKAGTETGADADPVSAGTNPVSTGAMSAPRQTGMAVEEDGMPRLDTATQPVANPLRRAAAEIEQLVRPGARHRTTTGPRGRGGFGAAVTSLVRPDRFTPSVRVTAGPATAKLRRVLDGISGPAGRSGLPTGAARATHAAGTRSASTASATGGADDD